MEVLAMEDDDYGLMKVMKSWKRREEGEEEDIYSMSLSLLTFWAKLDFGPNLGFLGLGFGPIGLVG
jgi:hypothetical protein